MRHPLLLLALSATACSPKGGPADRAYARLHSDSGVEGKSFEGIVADARALAARHLDTTEVVEYGTSAAGRKLTVMKIWDKTLTVTGKRPAILISEAIHGNEYLNITDRLPQELLEGGGANSPFKTFLAKGGILYVVPIMNPDGYAARQRENAHGQDLNRDFAIKAAGNDGFTQPETKAITSYIAKEATETGFSLEASMEYHCCIGGLIHPWAYTAQPLPKEALERQVEVGKQMQTIFGYRYGTVREIVGYDAVGGSDDYYLETYGRRAFSFEGAEGSEFRNLSKHVDMWNFVFGLAASSAGTSAEPAKPGTATSNDLFLAVGPASSAENLRLFGATPDTYDGFVVCLDGPVACLDANGKATKIATKEVLAGQGRRVFEATSPLAADKQTVTLVATKGGKIDALSVTRTVTINKK